jgi:hypothetical protein
MILNSQSEIRLIRALAHFCGPYGLPWREAWAVSGRRNPIPEILALIDRAIEERPKDSARMVINILMSELAGRDKALEQDDWSNRDDLLFLSIVPPVNAP